MNQLQKWQKKHGLLNDGVPGKKTLGKMKAVFCLTNEQLAHFMGQMAHESQNFTREYENLNYSYERLLQIFSYDFDRDKNRILSEEEKEMAMVIAWQPEKIANFVYANQGGNGDEFSGDGWKFRGRGPLQLTLRSNYERFAKYAKDPDIVCNPDIIVEKYYFESALWFFKANKLWPICSKVNDMAIEKLTRRINGGLHGINQRIRHTRDFYAITKTL